MSPRLLPVLVALGLVEAIAFAWVGLWAKPIEEAPSFGLDLGAYREAAIRLMATGSPYHDSLLAGPIENRIENVPIAYLYPPPLAQALVPFASLDSQLVATIWAAIQAAAFLTLLPLVYRRYGGGHTVTSTLFIWLTLALSFPANFALYVGNVSGWIAIAVAVMLLAPEKPAAIASVLVAIVKMTPTFLLIPVLIRRESRAAALVTVGAVVSVSFWLAPRAWSQWFTVLPSILRFPPASDPGNLAPVSVLGMLGFPTAGAIVGLAITVVAVIASIAFALRGAWAGAVAAATGALLFAPSTIWDHYLVILFPILIAAWPKSDWWVRVPIVLFMVVSGFEWLGLLGTPLMQVAYLAAAILVTGATTAWLASSDPRPAAAAVAALLDESASSEDRPSKGQLALGGGAASYRVSDPECRGNSRLTSQLAHLGRRRNRAPKATQYQCR